MTISTSISKVAYVGDGFSTVFAVPMQAYAATDFTVLETVYTGGVTTLVLNSSYTMASTGSQTPPQWTLTLASALPVGTTLTIELTPLLQQQTTLVQGQAFPSLAVQTALDRTVQMCQRLSDQLTRTVHAPDGDQFTGNFALPIAQARANTYLGFDANGNVATLSNLVAGTVLSAATIGGFLYPLTNAESAASAPISAAWYPPLDVRRYGALFNNVAIDNNAINAGFAVGGQTVNGSQGNSIILPVGVAQIGSQLVLPNRVRVLGQNKRGAYLQANSGTWNSGTSPYMAYAVGGTWAGNVYTPNTASSMFDSTLENLTLDCNNVAGLGGVQTQAWQEDCGLRAALITNFTTFGVRYLTSTGGLGGGQSLSRIADTEMFGGTTAGAVGLQVDLISVVGAFMMAVQDTTIAGSVGYALAAGIKMVNDSLNCKNVHFEQATTGIYLDGVGQHVLSNVTGGPGVTTLVTIASTFTGTLKMIGCLRNGATNFIVDNRAGGLGTISGYDIPELSIVPAGIANKSPATAHAWCTFNGTTAGTNAPLAGYNVTSVTRNSAGNYTVTFTRGLTNSSCAPVAASNLITSGTSVATQEVGASSCNVLISVSGTPTDSSEVKFICFGQ